MKIDEKKSLFILLILSCLSFFSNLGMQPADLMESRNFITAREMVQSGNYLITTMNGTFRFEKPPLPTWMTALMIKFFGVYDEWVLRIPIAIVSILFIFCLYYFVKYYTKNIKYSFICAFVGSTTLMIVKTGNENAWDMMPYAFAFGSLTFMSIGFGSKKMLHFILAGICIAASLMSKGPVAIFGLFIPFLISYFIIYGKKDLKGNAVNIIVMLVTGTLLAAIWPVVVMIKYKDTFLAVMEKEKNTWGTRHTQAVWFYLDYFVYMGVWIFFSLFAIFKKWSNKRVTDKNFFNFIYIWNLIIIVFLSIIKMKKKRYGIPIYFTSSMMVGSICYYYYDKLWSQLKKSDKVLLLIQLNMIVIAMILGPIGFWAAGIRYCINDIYLYSGILMLLLIPIYIIFFYTLKDLKDNNNKIIKFTIFASGILFIIFFFCGNLIGKYKAEMEINNNVDKGVPYLGILKKYPPEYPVFSDDFEIEDVWNMGTKIKKLDEMTAKEKEEKDIYFYSKKLNEKLSSEYDIITRRRYANHKYKEVVLYHLRKKEINK